jgi:hypothetical protein
MPIDPKPDPAGNLRVESISGVLYAAVVPRNQGEVLYRSHFATCPYADQHRRR